MAAKILLGALLLSSSIIGFLSQEILIDGDVYIEGIFTLYEDNGGHCSSVLVPSSVQHLEAVRWTIEHLDLDDHTHPLQIGLKVHATCGSVERAQEIAYNISARLHNADEDTIAVIGPERSDEAEVVSGLLSPLPETAKPLQMAFSAGGDVFNDKDVYKNFYRVFPPKSVGTKTVSEFLSEMFWTYVAVFHDDTPRTAARVDMLKQHVHDNGQVTCFPRVVSVDTGAADITGLIQTELQTMFDGDIPIEGVVIIGSGTLINEVLKAIKILKADPVLGYESPVLLLVEDIPFGLQIDDTNFEETKGIYVTSPVKSDVNMFEDAWIKVIDKNKSVNVFVNALLEQEMTQCQFDGQCTWPTEAEVARMFPQSVYTGYSIKAVLATVAAIDETYKTQCSNSTSPDFLSCMRMNVLDHLSEMDIDLSREFATIGDEEFSNPDLKMNFRLNSPDVTYSYATGDYYDYAIYNHQADTNATPGDGFGYKFEKVFEYSSTDGKTKLITQKIRDYLDNGTERVYPDVRKPQCPVGKICEQCPGPEMAEMRIVKGDMYIIGIVPVHTAADDALTCGAIKKGGFDVAEAIMHTVENAKDLPYSDKIPDGKLGVIIIDSCNDAHIISARILQLLNQGIFEDGEFIEVKSKILGIVGGWVSDNSIAIASILSRVGAVQISYGSTSPVLSDRDRFPYFMRMIPNDIHQGKKMIEIVKRLGSNLVQILYSKTAYGTGGKDSLLEHARDNGVCVSQVIGVHKSENIDSASLIANLTAPNAPKIIMVYLSSFHVVEMMHIFEQIKGHIFVASEAWGNRDLIADAVNLEGSITLANELAIQSDFKRHVESISKAQEKSRWLTEYLEDYFHCYHEWSFDKASNDHQCRETDYLQPQDCYRTFDGDQCFKIETWVPFAEIAVETMLRGAKITLEQLCNGDTTQICQAYLDKPRVLVNNIKPLKVAYNGRSEKEVYDDNHDGLIDLNAYMIKVDDKGVFYEEMALDWQYRYNQSTCALIKNAACQTCFMKPAPPPEEAEGNPEVIAMTFFIVLSVLLMLTIAAMVITYRKRILCFRRQLATKNYGGDYISPMHVTDDYITTLEVARDQDKDTDFSGTDTMSFRDNTCSSEGTTTTAPSSPANTAPFENNLNRYI